MVECCISALGDRSGRRNHAHRWFSDHTLITAFMNIHENTFETVGQSFVAGSVCVSVPFQDCRQFLTILNRAAGPERRWVCPFHHHQSLPSPSLSPIQCALFSLQEGLPWKDRGQFITSSLHHQTPPPLPVSSAHRGRWGRRGSGWTSIQPLSASASMWRTPAPVRALGASGRL